MNGCELPIKTNDAFNVLKAELGSDVERFVQLHALTTNNGAYTDDFVEYCKTKYDIDIQFDSNENVDTIVTAIKDYALIKDLSVKYGSEMQNATDLSVRYGYTSDLARKEMFKFAVHRIINVLSNIQVNGKTFAQELGKDDVGNLKNPKKFLEQKVLKSIGENISAEFAKLGVNKDTIKALYRTGKLSELNDLAIKHNGNKELKNLIAGLREMKDSDRNYFDEVFHSKELTQFKIKELAEVLSEVDNIRAEEEEQNPVPLTDEHDDDESKDDSYNVYENHLGTLSDASKHIPVDLKLYLNGVPKLNSNKRFNQDGSTPKDSDKADANKELLWDVKKNADTGLDEFVSYKEAQAILFSYINYSSKSRMIKSMNRIASTLPNGKFLYKIADDCEHNTDLRNKIFRNFKKNRIEKHQVVITDEGVSYNISNIESDRKSTLFYSLLTDINNNFKTAIQITGFNKVESNITNLFNIIQNNPTKDNTVIIDKYVDRISEQIYELTKQYFPTISQDSIRAFINQPDLFTQPYNIKHPFYQLYTILNSLNTDFEERRKVATRLEQERADAIKNNKEYNDWFEEATDPNIGQMSVSEAEKIAEKTGRKLVKVPELESAITPDDKNNINKLTKLLLDFVPIYCPNNSKNSKGDQSSDHINDSWITYLNDVLSDKDSIKRFGDDIFRSVQADYNTILVENKEIGNKGLFKLENGKYVPTAYAEDFMHFSLFDGVNNRTSGEGAGHSDLGAIDQDVTSLHAYFNPKLGVDEQYGSTRNIKYARYFLRVPADATNTFDVSLPRYDIDGLLSKGVVNRNHPIFKQYKNAAIQILTNAMHVAKVCCDADPTDSTKISKVVKPGTEAKCKDTKYFMNGSTFFDKNGNPTGNVFKSNIFSFNTIDSDGNKIPVKDFDERLMSIASFFYDGVNDNVFKLDGNSSKTKIAFTKEQNDKLEDLVSEFIIAYSDSGVAKFKNNNLSEYINLTDAEVQEYTLNYKLVYCNLDFLLEGSQGFYGDVAKFLKRAKEVQGSGTAQAAYDSTADSKYNDTEVLDIDMTVTKGGTKYSYNKTKFRKAYDALKQDKALSVEKIKEEANRIASRIEMKPTFKAVIIRNSEITEEGCLIGKTPEEDGYLVQAIRENMKEEIGEEDAIELSRRIMGQYADAKANDAQSYITFEEFIRRLAQKGQLNENKPLIEKILNEDEPIDVNDLVSFVQVLKNFYFDQHFDEEFQMYTPRQIKNSEFVLIPRFIKGTELEVVHDLMEKYGIDQINTIETSKAYNSNILELWDKDGNLPAERNEKGEIVVKPFEDALALNKYAIQEYSYRFMYTQQEGVQHINANNKLGLQIAKKILDNIKVNDDPRYAHKQDFIKCLVANIQDSFEELQKELEYTIIDKKPYININNFLEKFKKQADTLGLDTASYDYLTLENEVSDLLYLGNVPLTKMPMELSAFSVKLEQIANALFNTMVTRQTLPGFHGAQVTGIGFKELGTKDSIKKDKNLQYHPKLYTNAEGKTITQREYDKLDDADKPNYKYSGIADYIEIRISKSVYPIKVTDENGNERSEEDLLNELRNLGIDEIVGYRIPSESKHSIAKMKIVGFLDSSQGTTIVVPTGWVPQTGSDFDIDSIYGITYDVSLRNGKLYKETLVKELTDDIYANYIAKNLKIYSDKDYNNLDEIRKQDTHNVKYSEFTNRNALLKSYIDAEKSRVFAIKKDNVANTYTFIDGEAKDFLNKLKAQYTITTSSEKKDLHTAQINLLNKLISIKEGLLETQKADPKLAKEADATASRLNNLKKYKDALVQLYAPISVNIKAIKTEHKEELRQALNEDYKKIGKEKGFLLDDFKSDFEKHPERYNTRTARNNEMVNAISNIIADPKSWEEMFSPSGFADIMEGIAEYSDPRVKQANDNRTPYDIWDQCELHGEVVSGKKLKGISVMSDTATSVFSQTKARIRTKVTVIPKGSEEKQISDKLGWIDENFRNFAGRIQTDYVCQTTCHQLDVLKAGAVRNVTEDTFNMYKIFVMLGFTYDTAISFISQPAIEKLVNTISKTKSVYSDDYGSDALFKTLLSAVKNYATVTEDIALYDSVDSCSNIDEIITALSKTHGVFKDHLEELHNIPSALIAEDDAIVNSNMYSQRIKNDNKNLIPLDDRIRNYCFGSDRFYNEIEVDDDSVVEVFISSNEGITSGKVLTNKKVNNGEIVTNDYSKSKKAYGIMCSDAKTKQMHISTQAIVNNIVKLCEEAIANPNKTFKVNLSSTNNEEAFGLTGQDLANMFIMAGARCSIKEIPSNVQFSKTWEKANVFNKNNNIDASVFDIGVLITYKKIKNISDKVMAVAKHLRYDKEGAKQSIYETKQLEDDLDNLINAKEPFVLAEDGRNLLTAIYRTSLEDSVYPQLKAFHDYCTIPSIDINGSIFVTAKAKFDAIINSYTEMLRATEDGKNPELNPEERKKVAKYLIGQVLASTVKDKVIDISGEKPVFKEIEGISKIIAERDRMEGINYTADILFNGDEIVIDDMLNPSEEQIEAFSNLSPAQKVLWLQKNISDAGIFNKINVVLSNQTQTKRLGYSKHNIYINTKDVNVDDLRLEFNLAYYSRSPIVKLVALDLIKYAVEIEQYDYDTNGIYSIIPNDCLIELGIIDQYRQNYYHTDYHALLESYVNKNYKDIYKLYQYVDRANKYNIESNFGLIIAKRNDKIIKDITHIGEQNKTFIDKYVKIKRYKNRIAEVTLYKTVEKGPNVFLIPVNPIEGVDTDDLNPKRKPKFLSEYVYNSIGDYILEANANANASIYIMNKEKLRKEFGNALKINFDDKIPLAMAKPFDINNPPIKFENGFEQIVNAVNLHFNRTSSPLYVRNVALSNYITNYHGLAGSVQVINGREYYITRQPVASDNKNYIVNPDTGKATGVELTKTAQKKLDRHPFKNLILESIENNIKLDNVFVIRPFEGKLRENVEKGWTNLSKNRAKSFKENNFTVTRENGKVEATSDFEGLNEVTNDTQTGTEKEKNTITISKSAQVPTDLANKRKGLSSNTYLDAIKNNEISIYLIEHNKENIDFWKDTKIGDIIEFTDGNENILIKVTDLINKVDKNSVSLHKKQFHDIKELSQETGYTQKFIKEEIVPNKFSAIKFEYISKVDDVDNISTVTPNEMGNMYSDIIEEDTINTEGLDPLSKFAVRSVEIIKLHSIKEDNNINYGTYQKVKEYKATNSTDFSKYPTKEIIAVTRNYLEQKYSELETKLAVFSEINGTPIPMNSEAAMEIIKNDAAERNRFEHILLEASALRNQYEIIDNIALTADDYDLNEDLTKIKNVIGKLKSDTELKLTWKRYFEEYVISLSTDPRIKDNMLNLFENFYNTNRARYLFENVQENHTPIVQIILKTVMDDTRANELATNKEVVDFNKTVNEIEQEAFAAGTPVNYDKIINEKGIRIREYKPEFVDALSELSDKVNEIAITEGKDSIAYHKAANELLKFKHDNIEQALISDYYKELATINDSMLNVHPDIFVAYKRIVSKLAEFNTMEVDGELTTALEIEKTKVLDELKELLSEGQYNPSAGGRVQKPSMYDTSDKINNIDAVNALKEYIEKNKAIREKYFENNPKLGWTEKLLKNLQIVEDYELRFGGSIPISHLERYPEYNKAKRWIRNNAIYTGDSEEREKLNDAYNVLRRGNSVSGRETFNNLVKQKKAIDYQGIVDGRVFNDKEIDDIREAQEKRFNIAEGVPYNEDTLLSNSPKAKDVFTKEFYEKLTIPGVKNAEYIKIVKQINDILIKYRNPVNGEINTSSISIEDLKALKPLYRKIIYTPNENGFDPNYITKKTANEEDIAVVTKFINENCEAIVNEESYKKHYDIARSKGLEYFSAWLDTNLVYDSELMSYAINPRLYGTLVPLNYEHGVPNKFVDTERTEAVNTIKSLSRSEPTQYYFETRREKRETLSEEDYNEWIKRNHIYNPITGELEPIDCWMHTVILSENPEDKYDSAKYEPTKNNLDSIPRAFAVNPNYDLNIKNPYANYKKYDKTRTKFYDVNYDNEEYDTLTPQELKIKNLFDDIIESKAVTRAAKRHFAKGYMPAEYKAKEYNLKEFAKDAGETIGFKIHNSGNDPYDYNVGYESSYIRQLPMAAILENANSVKPNYAKPKREHYATQKEYDKAMTEFKNKLAEDEKTNLEIHSQLINKNWKNVMSNFIRKANDYKTIKNNEGLLYMGQQFLEQLNTYKLLSGRDKLMKADKFGTTNEEKYAKEKRNYVIDEFNVFLNRYINKQYREPNGKLTRFADSLQTFTSAMYMSGNVLGGVANVTVGNVNILMEAVAGEYIGAKTWTKGRITYDKGVPYYLKDMYSDKASSLESALVKLFYIVDFDQFAGVVDSNNVSKFMEKARDVQYAPQHLGEHRMQNSVLFGLMESHRLYTETDSNGKIKVVAKTLDTVKRDVEETALKAILSEKDLHKYELFKKYIKEDANKYKDYVTFDKNFVTEFINNDYISVKQRKEFIKKKEELEKSIEKEFNDDAAHPTLFSQFEFKEGYASIKENSVLGGLSAEESNKILGAFKNKVILINDKIHGSYDKLGGGAIETTKWYGRLVTQYHKHLYPGIMKHYRTQGYYNEVRETVEKGGLSSTIAYLSMPFRSAKFRKEIEADLQAKGVTGYEELLDFAEINQNVLKRALSLYTNIVLNWKIMSETDRNNIRRMVAELTGPAIAIAATVGVKLAWDDDDSKDDSLAYNFFIHELDRFSTECIMYNPLGIVAEGKKLWSSPIAAQSALGGIVNICGYTAQYLTNDDFNWVFKTGSHAGEHKLLSQIERRIPLYHSYYNITRLQKNNRFFKLEKNYLGIGLADPIVEFIK
ncbi:MAG: hypothetical protein MJ209_00195 [archaeon]|nr:hypothetical protein [archaeon]